MILAIDTATEVAGIALSDPATGQPFAERTWRSGRNHTRELLPEIDRLLAIGNLSRSAITSLAVVTGPGSFNGLRVGLTTAKILAVALSVPLVGVDTLQVTAQPFVLVGQPIRAMLDAGRGQVATAYYESRGDALVEVEPPRIANLDEIVAETDRPTIFCGEIRSEWHTAIVRTLGTRATFPTPAGQIRRAAYLAELARRRLMTGSRDDPTTLQPVYLRRPPVRVAGSIG